VISFPAGLCDKEDKDITTAALRELKEETGYTATDFEMIVPPSPTSEGLSDECNAVVICRLLSQGKDNKEEFEDISAKLYSVEEVKALLADEKVIFSNSARLLVLYLLERFKNK
jgi:8-oxo-dGTP pyrophosphatase MutT (NUDIX family)